jgi:hypothetical protein
MRARSGHHSVGSERAVPHCHGGAVPLRKVMTSGAQDRAQCSGYQCAICHPRRPTDSSKSLLVVVVMTGAATSYPGRTQNLPTRLPAGMHTCLPAHRAPRLPAFPPSRLGLVAAGRTEGSPLMIRKPMVREAALNGHKRRNPSQDSYTSTRPLCPRGHIHACGHIVRPSRRHVGLLAAATGRRAISPTCPHVYPPAF